MADLVVGRSEGVAYANNNLTYSQFKQPIKPVLKHPNVVSFIDLMVKEIHDAKSDKDIGDILYQVYITTQYDSMIRNEFDCYGNNK